MAHGNTHYAQRAIFKNWSARNAQGQFDGFVCLYDLVRESFSRIHCREVFARDRLFDAAAEQRFNQLVEAPLARFRDARLKKDGRNVGSVAPVVDSRTFRALSLLWHLNVGRFSEAYARDNGARSPGLVSELLSLNDEETEAMAASFRQKFDLATVPVWLPLFYPEAGCFPVPMMDRRDTLGVRIAVAFPLDPHVALVAIPRGLEFTATHGRRLYGYSVGVGRSRSVIVPSALANAVGQTELAEIVVGLRKWGEHSFAELRRFARETGHHVDGPIGPYWPS